MSAAPPTVAGKRPFPRWRSKSITVDTEVEVYVSEILDRVETEDLIDELRERAAAGDAVPNDAIPEMDLISTLREVRRLYHDGARDKVADLAYRLAVDRLGLII